MVENIMEIVENPHVQLPEFDFREQVSTSGFSLARTFGTSTGVGPRRQN